MSKVTNEVGKILNIASARECADKYQMPSALVFMVGDEKLDGVISCDIDEIKADSIVTATIKLNVSIGR